MNLPSIYPLVKHQSANLSLVLWGVFFFCLLSNVNAADAFTGYYGGNHQLKPNAVNQRDPFTTSDKMYGEVGVQSAQKANGSQGFIPGFGNQAVPKMRLKGFVTKTNKKASALLDVEGAGVYLVTEGDEIGLQSIGQNSVIKIIKVDNNGVRVQAGQINQVIIVR